MVALVSLRRTAVDYARRCAAVLLLALLLALLVAPLLAPLLAWCELGAQTPSATTTAGGVLTGVVRDIGGPPLANVDVRLIGEPFATRTDSAGRFTLANVPAGNHTALFRRLGYTSVDYRWVARSARTAQIAVTMAPAPRALERVVIEAPGITRRRGTSSVGGTVTDSAGIPLAGADVRLLGSGLSTITDSSGAFEFEGLAAGAYMVRIRRRGLRSSTSAVQIIDDDRRAIAYKLFGLPRNAGRDTASASGYGFPDQAFAELDRRARSGMTGIVIGPADLVRANRTPLDVLLSEYRGVSLTNAHGMDHGDGAGGRERASDAALAGECLLIDGRRPVYQPLGSYSAADVQLVEVFPPSAFVDPALAATMDALPECRGDMHRRAAYFVLWTRMAR